MALFKKKKKIDTTERVLRVVSDKSSFGYIEAYKSLRTNINYLFARENGGHVLMVTSAVPAEGKSNVAVNLAITLAQSDKRVILLDCDLRKGTLHRYLRVPRHKNGISEILSEDASWKDVVAKFTDINIFVLTAGVVPENPSELLSSEKMAKLIRELSNEFDYVILDTPPVNAVTDASILSRLVDGAVLVVSHNKVTRENVLSAKEQLDAMNTRILGVVFNMYDAENTGTDNSKYYSYYNYNYNYGEGYGYGSSKHKKKKAFEPAKPEVQVKKPSVEKEPQKEIKPVEEPKSVEQTKPVKETKPVEEEPQLSINLDNLDDGISILESTPELPQNPPKQTVQKQPQSKKHKKKQQHNNPNRNHK